MASGGGFSLGGRQSAGRGRVASVGVAVATTFVLASALAPLVNAQQCGVWLPAPSGGASLLGVTYGGSRYVAVGSEGASTSTDGSAWTPIALSLGGKPLVR